MREDNKDKTKKGKSQADFVFIRDAEEGRRLQIEGLKNLEHDCLDHLKLYRYEFPHGIGILHFYATCHVCSKTKRLEFYFKRSKDISEEECEVCGKPAIVGKKHCSEYHELLSCEEEELQRDDEEDFERLREDEINCKEIP